MKLYHIPVFLRNGKSNFKTGADMSEMDYMNECTARDVITMLVEKRNMSIMEAMDTFYNSRTFENLSNKETGLYFQSPVYIYDVLEKELKTNRDNTK